MLRRNSLDWGSTTGKNEPPTSSAGFGRTEAPTELLGQAVNSEPQRPEAALELAKAYRRVGRWDDADALLGQLIDVEAPHERGSIAAEALEQLGEIEIERHRPQVAARHFLESLQRLDDLGLAHVGLRTSLLIGLVSIAVEALDLRLLARVRGRAEAPDLAAERRPELRHLLVIGTVLAGDVAAGWAPAFDAARTSPSGVAHVRALVDLAMLARAAGDTFTPACLSTAAADSARHVDWQAQSARDRQTLLAVIDQIAAEDITTAGELLVLYEAAVPARNRDDDVLSSEQIAAEIARAIVSSASGSQTEQVSHLGNALAAARRSGNHYAEVTALLMLLDVDPKVDLLRRADQLTRLIPRSWLRRRFEVIRDLVRGPLRLSRAERRVMDAICEGLSTAEIAKLLGRSVHTVRNQTQTVYQVMDVGTRSALVLRCARLGLLRDPVGAR